MMFYGLDKEDVLKAGQAQFKDAYVEYDEMDFYLPDIEKAEIMVKGIDIPFYVSTHYAYEDRLVNGNQTRYKVSLPVIYTKQDPFEIIYDSKPICYVAYQEEAKIKFILYTDFYDAIKGQIEIIKENES